MLNDSAIRSALLERLRERWASTAATMIVEEFGTHYGGARADLAVINGHLWGYEIKSAADRLDRLPTQIRSYGEVFDYVTLVAAERHLERAMEAVPTWWGVMVAFGGGSTVRLKQVVRPRKNPCPCPKALAGLLWRDELAGALRTLEADLGVRSATRDRLAERLVQSVSSDRLGELVRDQLRGRPGWRADPARTPGAEKCHTERTSSGFLARRVRSPHR